MPQGCLLELASILLRMRKFEVVGVRMFLPTGFRFYLCIHIFEIVHVYVLMLPMMMNMMMDGDDGGGFDGDHGGGFDGDHGDDDDDDDDDDGCDGDDDDGDGEYDVVVVQL